MTVVQKRNPYKLLVGRLRGNNHFKVLVAGNIVMDLEEIRYRLEYWGSEHERVSLVKKVIIKFWISTKCANLLSRWLNISVKAGLCVIELYNKKQLK
jgi:hypothetical protein